MPRNTAHQFTPAAERALAAAAAWATNGEDGPLEAPEIVLGLLSERECRAAVMLSDRGVHGALLRDAIDELQAVDAETRSRGGELSQSMLAGLLAVEQRLPEGAGRVTFATEHLLWAIVLSKHPVAAWLASVGVAAERIEAEVYRVYGYNPDSQGAIDLEGAEAIAAPTPDENCRRVEHDRPLREESARAATPPSPRVEAPPTTKPLSTNLARVLDASANRAREALRVVEDHTRLALDDRHLTGELKHLRHELTAWLELLPARALLAARDTEHDVGVMIATAAEMSRDSLRHVATANFKRLEESLRSLEEHAKLFDGHMAAGFETIRYRAYTLEKAVGTLHASLDRLAGARLYVLIDGRRSAAEFERLVAALVSARVPLLQLRDKELDTATLAERARLARRLTRDTGTRLIVNDSPELAASVEADGVHVGQDDATVRAARSIVGPDSLVGVSTHSLDQARRAVLDGADYLGVGPVFPSDTKSFDRFPGLELVAAVSEEIRLPAFAIGGIGERNLADVLAAGATRVAVGGAVLSAADPMMAAERLTSTLALRGGQR